MVAKSKIHTGRLVDQVPAQGQRVGYVRVSSVEQSVARQLDGIQLERVFEDKASGKDRNRPQSALLQFVRDGDTVLVHNIDRLSRNLDDLRGTVLSLTRRGVRVEFVKESLTFTGDDSAMSNLLLSVMGAFAEFERQLICERQKRRYFSCQAAGRLPGPEALAVGRTGR
jgi:DNA invertase Pin-like site-specific DNA recombinase